MLLRGEETAAKKWFVEASEQRDPMCYLGLYLLEEENDKIKESLENGDKMNDQHCRWKIGRCNGYGYFGFEKDIGRGLSFLNSLPSDHANSKVDVARLMAYANNLAEPSEPHQMVLHFYMQGANLGCYRAIENIAIFNYRESNRKRAIKFALIGLKMRSVELREYDLMDIAGTTYGLLRDRLLSRLWHYRRLEITVLAVEDICKESLF